VDENEKPKSNGSNDKDEDGVEEELN